MDFKEHLIPDISNIVDNYLKQISCVKFNRKILPDIEFYNRDKYLNISDIINDAYIITYPTKKLMLLILKTNIKHIVSFINSTKKRKYINILYIEKYISNLLIKVSNTLSFYVILWSLIDYIGQNLTDLPYHIFKSKYLIHINYLQDLVERNQELYEKSLDIFDEDCINDITMSYNGINMDTDDINLKYTENILDILD